MPHAPIDDAALDQLFRTARTFNGYTDTPVTTDDIHAIYELLKMAPTSANQQPGRFVWLLDQKGKDKLAERRPPPSSSPMTPNSTSICPSCSRTSMRVRGSPTPPSASATRS